MFFEFVILFSCYSEIEPSILVCTRKKPDLLDPALRPIFRIFGNRGFDFWLVMANPGHRDGGGGSDDLLLRSVHDTDGGGKLRWP